jgi:hypothetical protein
MKVRIRLGRRAGPAGGIIVVVYAPQLTYRNPFIDFQRLVVYLYGPGQRYTCYQSQQTQ